MGRQRERMGGRRWVFLPVPTTLHMPTSPLLFEEGRVGGEEGGKVMEIGTKEVGAPTRVNNITLYSVHCTGLRATSYPCSLLHSSHLLLSEGGGKGKKGGSEECGKTRWREENEREREGGWGAD